MRIYCDVRKIIFQYFFRLGSLWVFEKTGMVKIREENGAVFLSKSAYDWEAMVQITSLKKLFWQFFPCFFTFLFCFASAWCRTEQQKLSKLLTPTFPVITRKRRTARQDNDLKLHEVIVIYDQALVLPMKIFALKLESLIYERNVEEKAQKFHERWQKKLVDFVHVMPCEIPIITLGVKVETSLELPRALENG